MIIKNILFSMCFLALVAGCTSMTPSKDAPPKVGDVYGSVSRTPSQTGSTKWEPDSKTLSIRPGGGRSEMTLHPSELETYTETYRYTCQKYTWGRGTCQDYVCNGGAGKSELWDAYYGAKRDQKVNALDKAILGIGQSSARKLHDAGIFSSKPRTWNAFRESMNTALRKNLITDQQYNEVFGSYEQANRENLGYGGCAPRNYSCDVYGLFPVTNGCIDTRQQSRVLRTLPVTVRLTVTNPILQSFETEDLSVTALSPGNIQLSPTRYTEYSMTQTKDASGTIFDISLNGTNRKKSDLPRRAVTDVRFSDLRGQNMILNVTVDPKYLGRDADKLMIHLSVHHCTPGGMFSVGRCGGDDESNTKTQTVITELTGATTAITLPTIPAGESVWVDYKVSRENSIYYHNTPTESQTADSREYKK